MLLLTVLAGFAQPGSAFAQDGGPTDDELVRPLEVLRQQQSALGLTPDQLGQLDRIQAGLATDNDPLVSEMMRLRTEWQRERRAARNGRPPDVSRIERIRSAAQDVRGRIQANNRTAMQKVNRLLTPAQRKQLRGIVEKRRQQNPGRGAGPATNAGPSR
ncbi:MAG TPA: Spy/CpxP family protein refolding chaperone [Vicinamibacterales bacterium]|nr:Spy/CpxP family protein refolding chaperone [Vicinamibacterales bacterium]